MYIHVYMYIYIFRHTDKGWGASVGAVRQGYDFKGAENENAK